MNSCKESFPTAVRAKSSRQAGRIRASFTSSISENVRLRKRKRRDLPTTIPMLAAESAALPERYPESLTTIPKTLTSAESVSKPRKTAKRLVPLSGRVSVCWLMRYPIQQRKHPNMSLIILISSTVRERKSSKKSSRRTTMTKKNAMMTRMKASQ